MFHGRLVPRANPSVTLVLTIALLSMLGLSGLALSVQAILWQPGSVVGSNCGCGWPGCGCLEMTPVPYDPPAANFTPWAGVDVIPPGSPPVPVPSVTVAASPAPPPAVPTSPVPTALPQPTTRPIPTQAPFPTPEIFDQ